MRRAFSRRMAHKCLVLLVVALSTSRALAGPLTDGLVTSDQCSTLCPVTTDNKFAFDADQTYEYDYETNVRTLMAGASEEQSSLHLRATARIEVLSRCEMSLRVTDVSLHDSDPMNSESRNQVERSEELRRAVEARALRFAFVDGHVEHICAEREDPVWVVNVKRAMLSAFQNTMESLENDQRVFETDVVGNCPTEYENKGVMWNTRTVKKTKDLLGCLLRTGPQSAFQGAPFQVPSDIQTLPLMKSSHECEQKINSEGFLTQSECTETHVFRPFSRQENGAKTEAKSKLVFKQKVSGVSRQNNVVRQRSSLLFDHALSAEEQSENVRVAKQTLTDLCTQTQNDIRPDAPSLFTRFVREARRLQAADLRQLFNVASRGSICAKAEKFFRDAIPVLGTEASIDLIKQLIEGRQATDAEAELWLTSISTAITRPTKPMIATLNTLLNRAPARKTYLTLSSLIHNYCSINEGCDSDDVIQGAIRGFTEQLRYNCRSENQDDQDRILMALKALGNTGYAQSAVDSLIRCAANNDQTMETRVAAMQAFRRMSCFTDNTEIFNLLENTEVDSELRINAYLVLMKCPNQVTLQRIVHILESEPINQVGSFIWTHLTNLQETSSPHKQEIRAILEKEELKKAFDLDKRKFSRNVEMSLFSELLNMGGSVESNVIFSEKSFIPRSAMVNLTAELFGQSINFFELGGRLQGMEPLLEQFFGPASEANSGRERRAVIRDESINMLDRSFDLDRERMAASYFLRMFGNEISYGDLQSFNLNQLKEKFNFLEWLIELANEHNIDVTKSMMLFEVNHVVPTISGMPLKLEADGAATVNVKVNGKMDIRRMFTSPSTFDISGSVKPSAALEVTSQMSVDAFVAKTGLKMVTTLHTSTVAQGKLQLTDGRIFNFDWDIPQETMEVISGESKFYVIWRNAEREQRMLNTDERSTMSKCLGGKFTTVFGLELCGELSYPWQPSASEAPFFPFNGPFMSKVYLNKRDTYSGFHFEAKYVQDKTRTSSGVAIKDIAKIQFNTPGSRVDREILFDFELDRANKRVDLKLKSPWKKADINGGVTPRSLTARVVIDDRNEYSFSARLTTDGNDNNIRYVPEVQVVIPGRNNMILDGSITLRQQRKYDIDLSLKNVFERPVSLRGSVDKLNNRRRMKYGGELELSSSFLNGKIEGFFDNNKASAGQSFASRLTVEYSYRDGPHQSIVLSNKIRDKSNSNLHAYSLDSAWRTTYWPRYDGEVSLDFALGPNTITAKVEAGLDDVRRIAFTKTATFEFGPHAANLDGNAQFLFPLKRINYGVEISHMHTTNEMRSSGAVKSDDSPLGSMSVALNKMSASPLKVTAEAKLIYPGREMAWIQAIDEKNPGEYHHNLDVQLKKSQTIRLESVYKNTPIHDLAASLSIPELDPMSLNVRLNPDLQNLMLHADTTFLRSTYMGEASSIIRGNFRPDYSLQNSLAMSWPGRVIEASSKIQRRAQLVTIACETSWEQGKTVTVNGQMKMVREAPEIEVKVTWPGNFVNVNWESKHKLQNWYGTENDLDTKIQFTSGFRGYQDISAGLKFDLTPSGVKSEVEAAWAPNQKIDIEYTFNKINGFRQVQSLARARTPFSGYRTVTYEVTYTLGRGSFEGRSKSQWDSKILDLALSGEMRMGSRRMVSGTMTLATPYDGYENIAASLTHNDDGSEFNTNFETQWAPRQKISTQFQMTHTQRGYDVRNNGELTVTTPFSGYRQSKMVWSHENDRSMVKNHIEVECDRQRGLWDLDFMLKSSRSKYGVELKTILQTPWRPVEDIRVNLAHSHDLSSYEDIKSEVSVQWHRSNIISYEQEIDISTSKLNMKAKLLTPYTEVITANLVNQFEPTSYNANNEVRYGVNKRIVLQSECSRQATSLTCNTLLTSPCPYLERVALDAELNFGEISSAKTKLEYAPSRVIELNTELGYKSVKKGSIELKTPWENARNLLFSTMFEGHGRNFESSTELQHNKLPGKISLLVKVDSSNLKRISGTVDFQSPFEPVQYFRSNLAHNRNNAGKIQNRLSVEMPQYQGSINNDMRIRGWQMHSTTTEIEYLRGRKIELTHEFSSASKVEGKVELKTPFDNFRIFALEFDHVGPATDFKTEGVINYNGYHINGETTFKLEGTDMTASAKVETSYNLMSINVVHSGDYRQWTNNANINFNGKQMTAQSEFSLNNMEPVGRLSIATPYYVIRTLNMNFEHTGRNWRNFENNAAFEYNGDRYTAGSAFKWMNQVLRMTALVNIPQEYGIRINHRGQATNFNTGLVINAGSEKVEGKTVFKLGNNQVELTSAVETSFPGFDNFEVSINHNGPASNFKTSANVITPFEEFQRLGAEYTHSLQRTNLRSVLKIVTPMPQMPTIVISLNHDGNYENFNTALTAEYSAKTVEATAQFAMIDTIGGSIRLTTPYRGAEKFVIGFNHEGPVQSFKTSVFAETPYRDYERLSAEYNHVTSSSGFNCNCKFESSIPKFQSIQVVFDHDMPSGNAVVTSASLETSYPGYQRFSANINHQGGFRRMRSSGSVQTPFTPYEQMSYEINHDATNLNRIKSVGSLNIPVGPCGYDVKFAGNAEKFKAGAIITSPFPDHNRYELTMDHTARTLRNIENSGKISTPMGDVGYALTHQGPSNRFQSSLAVTTPFAGHERYSAALEHTGDSLADLRTMGTVNWARGTIVGTLTHRGNLEQRILNTNLELTTPFAGYERMNGKIELNARSLSRISLDSNLEGSMGTFTAVLNHNGQPHQFTTTLTVTTPLSDYNRFHFNLDHNSRDLSKIASTLRVESPAGGLSSSLRFNGNVNKFETRFDINTPFEVFPRLVISLDHTSPNARSIATEGTLETQIGTFGMKFNHRGFLKNLRSSVEVSSPFDGYRQMHAKIEHNARDLANIVSNSEFLTPYGLFKHDFTHSGSASNFRTNLSLNTPFSRYESMSASLTHAAPNMGDIATTLSANYGSGPYEAALAHNGRPERFQSTLIIKTPIRDLDSITLRLNNNSPSLQSMSASIEASLPDEAYSASFSHNGYAKKFNTALEVRLPIRGHEINKIQLENDWERLSNILSKVIVTLPGYGGEYSGAVNYNGNPEKFVAGLNIISPVPSFRNLEISLDHTASDWSRIVSTLNGKTPYGDFSANIDHNGDWRRMQTTGGITTPIEGYEQFNMNIDHNAASLRNIQTNIQCSCSKGDFGATLTHRGTWKNIRSVVEITTPIRNLKRLGINIQNNIRDMSDVKSAVQVNTPMGTYSYDLQFNGAPKQFTCVLNLASPHEEFRSLETTTEVDVASISSLKIDSKAVTPVGPYSFKFTHSSADPAYETEIEIETPHRPYNKFTCGMSLNIASPIRMTVAGTTSVPGYERMSTTLHHQTNPGGIVTSIEGTTSIPGYDQFSASIDHSGGTTNPRTTISVGTPVAGHERYTLKTEKTGDLNNLKLKAELGTPRGPYSAAVNHASSQRGFRSDGTLTTPIRGYDNFGFEVSHEGTPQRMRTNAVVTTPFSKWERMSLGANNVYDAESNNKIQSTLNVNTAYPGYDEFTASLNHEGNMRAFKTNLQLATPVEGYRNFGFDVNHSGHIRQFNSRGTIILPFAQLPTLTVAVNHQGDLSDLQTTGSIEYNRKKIDLEALFKKTTGYSSSNLEGTLKLNSPYKYLQNVVLNGVHSRNGEIRTGSLDLTHNGQKSVDFDYSYKTGEIKNMDIEIRKPYPMSSSVNMRGNRNDATVNWDTSRSDSQVRFDLELKNEDAEKELSVRATLPSRVVGFTTTYNQVDGRVTHGSEVMWNSNAESKASYNIELSKSGRRSQNIHDGRLTVASPLGSMEATFNHVANPGRQYTTEVTVQRLVVRSDLQFTSTGHTHSLSAQHPRLPNNLVLSHEAAFSDKTVDGTIKLAYDSEEFTFVGHLSDASSYSQALYNARAQLTHPNSNLDAKFEGQIKEDSDIKSLNMDVAYLTSYDRQTKTASLRAEINKLRNALNMEVITPVKTFTLTASQADYDSERGVQRYEIVGGMDGYEIRGEFIVDAERKTVELKLYQDEDFLHMYAQMLSSSHAKTEVYTQNNGQRRQHAMASIRITEDQLVNSRFFLNPEIRQEIENYISQLQRTSTYRRLSRQVQSAFDNEIQRKQRALERAVEPFQPAIQFGKRQVNAISTKAQRAYDTMYRENQFYTRDIVDALTVAFDKISENIDLEMLYAVGEKIEVALSNLRGQWAGSVQQVVEWLMNIRPYWNDMVSSIMESIVYVIDQVKNNKVVAWVWDKIVNSVSITDIINPFEPSSEGLMDKLQPHIEKLQAWWAEVEQRPEMKYIKAYVKRTLAKSALAVKYLELPQRLKEMLRELHQINLATFRSQVIEEIRNYLQLEKNQWSVWNPEGGEIGFDLYWPFQWDDLKHLSKLRDINLPEYKNKIMEFINEYFPTIPGFSFYDYYYLYKPSSNPLDWIPPFKTYAAVMGSQHYMTFDKRFYEFAGECSYLLARDFIDGVFSVVVNYERQNGRVAKKSLTVITSNRQVEVMSNGRVNVDGNQVEMPLSFGNTTISRIGSMIRVDNTLGLTVDCNLVYDRCTVNVSGWYFSKTGGLFGTYNNEPADDFTTAENSRVGTPEQLADSWTAGRRCRPENYAVDVNPEQYTAAYQLCAQLFKEETSPLRSCFRLVDPQPFQEMCENDMPVRENRQPSITDTCNAAAFYVDVCRREGVNLRVPRECVTCQIESLGVEFSEGQNYTLRHDTVPQAADVVFVIQHSECNSAVRSNLKDVVDDLETSLKREGINDNRYGIVGYGGSEALSHAHTHTMDGQIFNTHDKFLLGLEGFTSDMDENADALAAVYYASKLPFRAGVSKTIILVPCNACEEKTTNYADVEQVLMQRNIHLHLLTQHDFRLNVNKDPVSAYIFGTDNERVFTRKDAGGADLQGDAELRQQILVPKDLCAALAMESDGSIFNTLQWTQGRPYMQKRFVDVMVRLIAEKAQPEECQRCDCVSDEYGAGRAVCKSCQSTMSFYSFLPGFGYEYQSLQQQSLQQLGVNPEDLRVRPQKRLRNLRRRNFSRRERRQ